MQANTYDEMTSYGWYKIENVDYNMDKYEFGEAARTLYSFVWDDFASWYVEISKVDLQSNDEENIQMTKNVLLHTLMAIIKMLHPFVPFITEEIYQALPHNEESITISSWPSVDERFNNDDAIESIDDMIEIITAIRNERNKAEDDVLKATAEAVKKIEEPKLVPMPGAEKLAELKDEYAGDGTPLAEVGEEIAEQAKIKAETAKRSKNSNMIEYNGRSQSLTKWAKELGMPVQTLYYRIKMKGWDIEKAFTK